MNIDAIKNDYDVYRKIYNEIYVKINDENTKRLLENSLYLSAFTIFEKSIKYMINNYCRNALIEGKKISDLSPNIAYLVYKNDEGRIKKIIEKHNDQKKQFCSYFKELKNGLNEWQIKSAIHFEFLHKDKLEGFYNDLFEELLGERDFLENLKLPLSGNGCPEILIMNSNALTFLGEYTEKIRNEIAHENDSFHIDGYASYNEIVDAFCLIISSMFETYEKHTKYTLREEGENLLDI